MGRMDIAERENSVNRSLERALHLLSLMEETGRSLSLTEISTAAQLHKPTAQRLLSVLERYGYAEKRQGRYHLGAAVLPLAYSYLLENELSRAALPVLQELAIATEETASLFVRLGFQRVVVQRVEGAHPLRYVLPIGKRLPLHVGVGKILAAAMEPAEIERMLKDVDSITHASGQTLTKAELVGEFSAVRSRGFSVSRNEREIGMASVAAPVSDAFGAVVAAVSVAGQTERFDSKIDRLVFEVRRAALAISERLGKA